MGTVDKPFANRMVSFLELLLKSYKDKIARRGAGGGLCMHSYGVYWDSYYSEHNHVDYAHERWRFTNHLRDYCATLDVCYQHSIDLGNNSSVAEVDVKGKPVKQRNYYYWDPYDTKSRIDFMENLISMYRNMH